MTASKLEALQGDTGDRTRPPRPHDPTHLGKSAFLARWRHPWVAPSIVWARFAATRERPGLMSLHIPGSRLASRVGGSPAGRLSSPASSLEQFSSAPEHGAVEGFAEM